MREKNKADEESLVDQQYVAKHIDDLDQKDFCDLEKEPDRIGHSELKSNNI